MNNTAVVVLNGPNLNRLGKRQPDVYGTTTLADVEATLRKRAEDYGIDLDFKQSNSEAELIGWVHDAADRRAAVIINPGGLTHTSVALRDALIEVHISNVHAREEFRHHSYLSPIAIGVITGLGVKGYELALEYFAGPVWGSLI